jgi:midasin
MAQIGSDESRPASLRTLGHSWIALSRFFLDAYVPDIPLDPAALQSSRLAFWSKELASLSHELDLEINLERNVTGNISNGTIDYLDEQIKQVRECLDNLPNPPLKTTRDLLKLREFWSEISQFMLKVIPESRLIQLAHAFHVKSPEASASEHVTQESIARFYRRLESVYPEFNDISRPLQSALLYLRLGIRIMAHASMCEVAVAVENLSRALTAFPSVAGATALMATDIRGDMHGAGWSPCESVLLGLATIAFEVELGVSLQSRIAVIENVYERAVRLWLIDQKRQEEADVAAHSLYRSNRIVHDAISDSKREEEEFLALFPDYEALLDPDHGKVRGPGDTTQQSIPVDESYPNSLMLLHLTIMTPGSYPSNALTHLSNLRATLLTSILDKYKSCLSEALDGRSFPHRLTLLAARLRDLNHPDTSKAMRPYNFYTDLNIPEIRRTAKLVEPLKLELDSLVREWPDQMVLQQLRDRCTQILALSAQSPVAKLLPLLEQLLLQTDDWEMYANKENTLKKHRHVITELIISWRQLELSSWRGLLRTQAMDFEEGVSEWWFRLYNAIVRGLLDIVDRGHLENLDEYLDQLVPLLDDFLRLSPLGQFSRRLDLLRSFGPFLKCLTPTKSDQIKEPLCRVQRVVYSVQTYYSQFVSSITSSLTLQEKAVEEEIKGLIKIASWKDVNFQALKASTKKTHHQLYKLVRKYRDIMRQPVHDLLQSQRERDPSVLTETGSPQSPLRHSAVDSSSLQIHVTLVDGPAHLRDLSKTYRRFDSLITTRIDAFLKCQHSYDLDDLAERMISTARELASVPISQGVTAERREKLWKALLVRKRKAWSDLVKEFKRIGLATNVQSTVLLQQKNVRWIREQPFPVTGEGNFPSVQSSEQCFFRLQGLLPRLRATLIDHHGDISTQELQRSVMLLESALSISLSCRAKLVQPQSGLTLTDKKFLSRLVANLNEYGRLKCVAQRLISIHRSSEISVWGPSVSDTVLSTEDALNRMCHALSETLQKVKEFGDLPGASPAPAALLESLQTLISSTEDCRDAVRLVSRKLQEAELPILLRGLSKSLQSSPSYIEPSLADEHDTVALAQRHVNKAQDLLSEWEKSEPRFSFIVSPLRDWLASQELGLLYRNPLPRASEPGVDQVIEALLMSIQSVLDVVPAEDQPQTSNQDNYLKDISRSLIRTGDLLRVDSKAALLNSLIEQLAGCSQEEAKMSTSRLLPFVQRYILLVEEQLAATARWVQGLFNLEFAACSVMLNIATNGFCKPPDAAEPGEAGTDDGTGASGVGFGEGTGNKNVNEEIEDESQVEGLKNESGEGDGEREQCSDDGDDAIEASDDFQGGLENVPDNGSEEEETPTDEGPEETLGDLDIGDPNTVDEKLWGDETGPRDDDQLDKANNDHSNKPSAHSEVVAKDNEPPESDLTSQEMKHEGAGDEGNDAESNDEPMPEDQADEDDEGDAHGDGGAALDDSVQHADILDLPDDLEMDEATNQQDLDEGNDDDIPDNDEKQSEISPESSPQPEITDGASLDGQRQEGGDTDLGLEDHDVSMQPDMQTGTGDGMCAEAVPNDASNSNFHEDPLESQSGGTRGERVTSRNEEPRHEDASVYLSDLLLCYLICVSAVYLTSRSRIRPQKTRKVVVPALAPRLVLCPHTKPSRKVYPLISRVVWEMPQRRPSKTLTIFLKAMIRHSRCRWQTPRPHTCNTSTTVILIMICKLSGLQELKKQPNLTNSTLRMTRVTPIMRTRWMSMSQIIRRLSLNLHLRFPFLLRPHSGHFRRTSPVHCHNMRYRLSGQSKAPTYLWKSMYDWSKPIAMCRRLSTLNSPYVNGRPRANLLKVLKISGVCTSP